MGIKGISLSETKDFVSEFDKDEPKTTWKLGALDTDIFDLLGDQDRNPLKMMSEAVRFGLKGFENFKSADGNEVKFDTVSRAVGGRNYKVLADNILRIIPPSVKNELGAEILKMSKLSGEEIKNS